MATNFPTGLDSFFNPNSGSRLDDPLVTHSKQHQDVNDAIEAIESQVGITGSTDPLSIEYRLHNILHGHNHDGINSRLIELSGAVGGTASLGPSGEDCDYIDGLFSGFAESTPVGHAICQINEVLKGLAPAPAPALADIGVNDTGVTGKLSFGSSLILSGYNSVTGGVGNLTPVDVNEVYQVSTFVDDLRRGIFNNSTTINGRLADGTVADSPNYPADAFSDADSGEVRLFLNGVLLLTGNLESTTSSFSVTTPSGSSLTFSTLNTGSFSNGSPFTLFKHRTGEWSIAPGDQVNGWNYVSVVRRTVLGNAGTDTETNFVSWVVDDDSTPVTALSSALHTLNMTGLKYLTGVRYYTGGTALYNAQIGNAYTNAYSTGNAVTFGGSTNISFVNQSLSAITGSEDQNKIEYINNKTGTISASKLLPGTITGRISCTKPIGTNLVNGGASSISGIFLNSQGANSTVLRDNFRDENFRLEPTSYDLQSDIPSNGWDSTIDRTGSVELPLVVFDETLVSLPNLPNSGGGNGDFTGFDNGPAGNVNYSGFTGNLCYYRQFINNTGGARSNFNLIIQGNGTIVTNSSSLGGNSNFLVEVKLPEKTGWNVFLPFQGLGQPQFPSDGAGILNGAFDSSLNTTNAGTFGTDFVDNGDYIVVRIKADAQWTGEITRLQLEWTS